MKITIAPDGTVELDVSNGEGQAALDLIRSLQTATPEPEEDTSETLDAACLTPNQLRTFDALLKHYPMGAHYTAIAEELGIEASVANSRCNYLTTLDPPFARRIRAGVYVPCLRQDGLR